MKLIHFSFSLGVRFLVLDSNLLLLDCLLLFTYLLLKHCNLLLQAHWLLLRSLQVFWHASLLRKLAILTKKWRQSCVHVWTITCKHLIRLHVIALVVELLVHARSLHHIGILCLPSLIHVPVILLIFGLLLLLEPIIDEMRSIWISH